MSPWRSARILVVGFLLVTACEREQSPAAPSPPPPPTAPKPEASQAAPKPEPSRAALRSLADAFVRDVIAGKRHAAYLKMDRRARASSTEAQFGTVLDGLSRTFGKLLEADYDSSEIGTSLTLAGIRKVWTFVYAVRTETKPKGDYQAEVELSADPEPGVSGFGINVTVLHGTTAVSGTAHADAASSLVNGHDGSNDLDWAALTKAKAGAWADYTMTMKKPLRNPDGSSVKSLKIRYALVEKTDKQMTIETITTTAIGDIIVQLKYVPAGRNAWRVSTGKTRLVHTVEFTKEQLAAGGGYATNDPKLLGTLVGHQSITTPTGAFECRHYSKTTPLAMERWVSDKVAPTGMVKAIISSMGIELLLTATGEDAVARIPL